MRDWNLRRWVGQKSEARTTTEWALARLISVFIEVGVSLVGATLIALPLYQFFGFQLFSTLLEVDTFPAAVFLIGGALHYYYIHDEFPIYDED